MRWLIRSALNDLMPSHAGIPGILDAGWDDFLARAEKEYSWTMYAGLLAGALVYVLTPVTTVYVPLPSFMLPASLRDRHAHEVMGSRIYLVRQAVFLLKLHAGFAWGAHPAVRERFSLDAYTPDPTDWRTE